MIVRLLPVILLLLLLLNIARRYERASRRILLRRSMRGGGRNGWRRHCSVFFFVVLAVVSFVRMRGVESRLEEGRIGNVESGGNGKVVVAVSSLLLRLLALRLRLRSKVLRGWWKRGGRRSLGEGSGLWSGSSSGGSGTMSVSRRVVGKLSVREKRQYGLEDGGRIVGKRTPTSASSSLLDYLLFPTGCSSGPASSSAADVPSAYSLVPA
jgi:hypothetical protein